MGTLAALALVTLLLWICVAAVALPLLAVILLVNGLVKLLRRKRPADVLRAIM